MAVAIIVKKWEHYNRSFSNWDTPYGKYIGSKKQYDEEMAKGGFVPYREVSPKVNKWVPSVDLKKTLGEIQGQKEVGGRLIDKMKSMGISFNPKFIPKDLKGGIDAT